MRNKYPGKCYRCGQPVGPGDGCPEKTRAGWRVRHEHCKPAVINKRSESNVNT